MQKVTLQTINQRTTEKMGGKVLRVEKGMMRTMRKTMTMKEL
jgi:hypothetical protein